MYVRRKRARAAMITAGRIAARAPWRGAAQACKLATAMFFETPRGVRMCAFSFQAWMRAGSRSQ